MRVALIAAMIVLLGFGCGRPDVSDTPVVEPEMEQPVVEVELPWEQVADQLARVEWEDDRGRMVIYRLGDETDLLIHTGSPRHVSDWQEETKALLAVNGTYFDENFSPSGYLQIDGERYGEREWDRDRSGIIDFDQNQLTDTAKDDIGFDEISTVAQSYPFLILEEEPAVGADSGKDGRRSFIGQDTGSTIYIGVVPHDNVTLFELSRMLDEMPIDWEIVLNLDGGTSTGVATETEVIDSIVPVPNAILVTGVEE